VNSGLFFGCFIRPDRRGGFLFGGGAASIARAATP
jgi:hypothetical protein